MVKLSKIPAFGFLAENSSIGSTKVTHSQALWHNIRKTLGYLPGLSLVQGIEHMVRALQNKSTYSRHFIFRSIVEMLGLGFLLLIPDIIVTCVREHKSASENLHTRTIFPIQVRQPLPNSTFPKKVQEFVQPEVDSSTKSPSEVNSRIQNKFERILKKEPTEPEKEKFSVEGIIDEFLQHKHKNNHVMAENCIKTIKFLKLKGLNLDDKSVDDDELKLLLNSCPSIRSLSLRKCKITNQSIKNLGSLKRLVNLDLTLCEKITEEALHELASLSQLESLNLGWCKNLTNAATAALVKLTHLTNLNLSGFSQLTDQGLKELTAKPAKLTSLNLADCKNLSDAALETLSELTELKSLDLSLGLQYSGRALKKLAKLTKLTSLNLMMCPHIAEQGLQELASKLGQLRSLSLSCCNYLQDRQLKKLAKLTKLTSLDMGGCKNLTDDTLTLLATELTALKNLNLAGCKKITHKALKEITTKLDLTGLNLSYCEQFTNEDLASLQNKFTKLQGLSLAGWTQLTDKSFSALWMLPQLTSLNLKECKNFSNEALKELVVQLSELKHLNLSFCNQLKLKTLKALSTLRPGLQIIMEDW